MPALAALSADAGRPRHLRLSRQQQCHSAKLRRPALHPRKSPLARQRPEQRASHNRGERFFPADGLSGGKCSTIAGASRSAALPPCWPVILSSEAGGKTFERCTRRAEPITSALCAVFVFGSWIDISKGPSARQSLFVSRFILTGGGCARPPPAHPPCHTT